MEKAGVTKLKEVLNMEIVLQKKDIEHKTNSKLMWIHYFQLRTVLANKRFVEDLGKGMTKFEKMLERGDGTTKQTFFDFPTDN